MMMNKTNDFLKDFTTTSCEPHSSTGTATIATTTTTTTTTSTSSNIPLQNELLQPAKKNIAMMMAVVFSVTFFGNSAPFFTVTQPTNGCNFSSMFGANPPKEFSQMNIASRIMASLENTSWKDFTDLSTWRANSTNAGSKTPLTSSDTSDTTDAESSTDVATDSSSCGSPESIDDCLEPSFENELIDDFVYPVEEEEEKDPLNVLLLGTEAEMNEMDIEMDTENDKYEDSALLYQEEQKTFYNPFQVENTSIGIYEKLTTLWQEKNQVLLTVTEGDEIVQRTIADMTAVKDSMAQSKDNHCSSEAALNEMMESLCLSEDQSVSFLYPMSAFAPEKRVIVSPSDEVFLEVSCQLNHDKHQQRLQRQQSLVDIEEASLVEGLQLGTHGISSLM
jgi:hypothetical protein